MALSAIFSGVAAAAYEEPEVSTNPIGSPFFRHLAAEFNLDLRELVKLEKRGFGRSETITLVLISSTTGQGFKEYAKRRMKEKVSLKHLAEEAGLDYDRLYLQAHRIKEYLEDLGDENLPPPVFESPSPVPTPEMKPEKKKKPKNEKT